MLSRRSIETLIDLVEIKLSFMQVTDREDEREKLILERALTELSVATRGGTPDLSVLNATGVRKRGRRPKMLDAHMAV